MGKGMVFLTVLLCFCLPAPPTQGAPVEVLEGHFIIGGQCTNASESSIQMADVIELPGLVEDYTATWCTNCVDVEHALEEIPTIYLQQYHFHRAIGETEDPFGSIILDERWEERYDKRIPPTVVFNGSLKKVGSVPEGNSLKEDYDILTNTSAPIQEGQTQFSWTPSEGEGVLTWNFDPAGFSLENYTVQVQAWFVETGATFEEGSNNLGYYPHIVKEIHSLGEVLNGTATLSIPTAYDGDDIEIHLMYEFQSKNNQQEPADLWWNSEEGGGDALPFIGLFDVILVIALVFVFRDTASIKVRRI